MWDSLFEGQSSAPKLHLQVAGSVTVPGLEAFPFPHALSFDTPESSQAVTLDVLHECWVEEELGVVLGLSGTC